MSLLIIKEDGLRFGAAFDEYTISSSSLGGVDMTMTIPNLAS